jgi:hypothetical protein
MLGEEGLGGVDFYRKILILKYVLVTAGHIGRLESPPPWAMLGRFNSRANLPATFSTAQAAREQAMWTVFFREAGMDERNMCAGLFLPLPSDERPD